MIDADFNPLDILFGNVVVESPVVETVKVDTKIKYKVTVTLITGEDILGQKKFETVEFVTFSSPENIRANTFGGDRTDTFLLINGFTKKQIKQVFSIGYCKA